MSPIVSPDEPPTCVQTASADRELIRKLRQAQGLSLRALALRAGLDPNRLLAWERGIDALCAPELKQTYLALAVAANRALERQRRARVEGQIRYESARSIDPQHLSVKPYLCTTEAAHYCGFKTTGALRKARLDGRIQPSGRRGGRGTWMWSRAALDEFLRGGVATIATAVVAAGPPT